AMTFRGRMPWGAPESYFPSIVEWGVSIGLIAATIFLFGLAARLMPVLTRAGPSRGHCSDDSGSLVGRSVLLPAARRALRAGRSRRGRDRRPRRPHSRLGGLPGRLSRRCAAPAEHRRRCRSRTVWANGG